jgi:CheY-like chemotaxis protein
VDDALILVVDDDEDVRNALSDVLEPEGFRVQTASNGKEGLQALAREIPSLVLLDMRMPILDGWGFAREAARLADPVPPLVVMTASDNEAEQCARETGARGSLSKPFGISRLLSVVEGAMKAA